MRLCYFAEALSVHVQRWAGWFARRGHEVHLVSLSLRDLSGVRVHSFPPGGALAFPRKVLAVRRIVREIAPDLVHSHQAIGYGLWGAVAGYHPFVVSAWGSDVLVRPKESWVQRPVLRFVLRRADYCIPVAPHLLSSLVPFGLRLGRCQAIPMGVELDTYPPIAFRRGTRASSFISTRALEPLYDIQTLVRASREIFAADPEIQGTILGGGSERDGLQALAFRMGVADRLRFEGTQSPDRVMQALGSVRVYVSTSRSDGASVSLMEAMARGCFPVVTDIPANREWVVDGVNGSLFPVGDAHALATKVTRALRDEDLLETASEKNVQQVRERGDLNVNLARVEKIYEDLVQG